MVYAQHGKRRDAIDGLILNSPYLAPLNLSVTESTLVNMLMRLNRSSESDDLWYGRSIHKSARGEWEFDLKKKPIDHIRLHGAFFAALRSAHQAIDKGEYHLACPILVMCSNRSIKASKEWRDEYHSGQFCHTLFSSRSFSPSSADLMLDVRSMKQAASLIGSNMTLYEISDGKHDLFLSKESVREKAFQRMFAWLEHLNNDWTKTKI